jgi:hypothetical protein
MNAITSILLISGLIVLVQSVCTPPPNIAELNQQLLEGNVKNKYKSLTFISKKFLF